MVEYKHSSNKHNGYLELNIDTIRTYSYIQIYLCHRLAAGSTERYTWHHGQDAVACSYCYVNSQSLARCIGADTWSLYALLLLSLLWLGWCWFKVNSSCIICEFDNSWAQILVLQTQNCISKKESKNLECNKPTPRTTLCAPSDMWSFTMKCGHAWLSLSDTCACCVIIMQHVAWADIPLQVAPSTTSQDLSLSCQTRTHSK